MKDSIHELYYIDLFLAALWSKSKQVAHSIISDNINESKNIGTADALIELFTNFLTKVLSHKFKAKQ